MFHSAGTGMSDQVPVVGGAVGVPVVGMKSHVPFREARTRPSCGRDWGAVVREVTAARATLGSDARARAAAPVASTRRRLTPGLLGSLPSINADILVSSL